MSQEGDSIDEEKDKGESKELRALLEAEKRRNEDCLTRMKYLQADFENYRKRTEKELRETEDSALRGLVVSLLSPLDELELAIENTGKEVGSGELLDGLEMVHKNLIMALGAAGLARIDCVGRPFDPSLHEAVEKIQGTTEGDDIVGAEIRPGYVFRGKVVRPSMVKVELAPRARGEQEEAASE